MGKDREAWGGISREGTKPGGNHTCQKESPSDRKRTKRRGAR